MFTVLTSGEQTGGGELRWGQTLTFHCIPHSTPEITDPEHGITSKKELLLYPLGLSFSVCFVHTEMRYDWRGQAQALVAHRSPCLPVPSLTDCILTVKIWWLARGQACFPPTETKQTTYMRSSLPLAFFILPVEPTEGT